MGRGFMTIEGILDELEGLLIDAARVPFTNKRVLEEDDVARLLDELREALPKAISDASKIMEERQRILEDAQKEAQNIVEKAKSYTIKLTDENMITKQAQEQSAEILTQAHKQASDLHDDAVAYADQVFKHLSGNLEKALEVVKQGHSELHQQQKK
jgi:cell division septum initiation protein DivIVA